MKTIESRSSQTLALAALLGQRFGDDQLYLTCPSQRRLLMLAMRLGLVCESGCLTPLGRQLWSAHADTLPTPGT